MGERTFPCVYCKSTKQIEDLKETMIVHMTGVDDENKEMSLTSTKEVIEAVIDIKTD